MLLSTTQLTSGHRDNSGGIKADRMPDFDEVMTSTSKVLL
jgi:hypothetical protein